MAMVRHALTDVPRSRRQYVVGTAFGRMAKDAVGAVPSPLSGYIEPLLATLVPKLPGGDLWLHEIKFDGYRLQVRKQEHDVSCFTRRGYDWRDRFPTIVGAAQGINASQVVLDGEAVIVTAKGDTDFSALESYVSSKRDDRAHHLLVYYVFDLLHLDGWDLRNVPLVQRKAILRALLADRKDGRFKFSEHVEGNGADILRQACKMQLEGIVSKRRDGRYRSGRNDTWVKATCRHRDTFAIVGIAEKGAKFDGVYLAREDHGTLSYAGKVEHGFDDRQVRRLKELATKLKISKSPIGGAKRDFPKALWLQPRLLADVEFRRMTGKNNLLRHPSYKGLREDLME